MRPRYKQFAPHYASMFGDARVVYAYQYRPLSSRNLRDSPQHLIESFCL